MWRPPRWAQTATRRVKFLMTASIVSCPMRRVSATMFAFSSAIVLGFDEYTLSFRWPQRKKSGGGQVWGMGGPFDRAPATDDTMSKVGLKPVKCPLGCVWSCSILLEPLGSSAKSLPPKNTQRKLFKLHFNFYCRKAFSKSFQRHSEKTALC